MKIFVRSSALLIKGSVGEVLQKLKEIEAKYPNMTLAEYLGKYNLG